MKNKMITVFCPRGCNITEVSADDPWDECAACGQRMTPQYEDDFYSVHERDLEKVEFEKNS